jgi:hypothetical protein
MSVTGGTPLQFHPGHPLGCHRRRVPAEWCPSISLTLSQVVAPAGHTDLAAAYGGSSDQWLLLPSWLFEHPAAELSVDDSAQLGEDRRHLIT